MSEPEGRKWCFGKMDHATTGPCLGCPDLDECYDISFEVIRAEEVEP